MKKLIFKIAILCLFIGYQANSFAGDGGISPIEGGQQHGSTVLPDPRDVEYAKYLYREKWLEHLGEIIQKRLDNLGNVEPTQLDSIIQLNNFFRFVNAADVRMRSRYLALDGYLKNAQGYNEAMRRALEENDGQEAKRNFDNLFSQMMMLPAILNEARAPLLKAASIYQVSLHEIGSDDAFENIRKAFVQGFISEVKELFQGYSGQVNPVTGLDSEIYRSIIQMACRKIINLSSFSYEKLSGETGYVSFVNFGKSAPHQWGEYGGDGAIDAASFQFLDF